LQFFFYSQWSFSDYEHSVSSPNAQLLERVASWLVDTSLFEQAWESVCLDPIKWWWSEQLCIFAAGAWTAFLATKGKVLSQSTLNDFYVIYRR
jgi:hypothetical protein